MQAREKTKGGENMIPFPVIIEGIIEGAAAGKALWDAFDD